jgi:hypothetical protein
MAPGSRPFVCEGSPYAQQAFIIGINATVGVGDFWDYWDDSYGMLKSTKFMPTYLKEKGEKISPTRKRIETLVSPNVRCLETNLYLQPTRRAKMLTDKSTECIRFLLLHVRPKVLLIHGKPPAQYVFERHCSVATTANWEECNTQFTTVRADWGEVAIRTVRHLWLPYWNSERFQALQHQFWSQLNI